MIAFHTDSGMFYIRPDQVAEIVPVDGEADVCLIYTESDPGRYATVNCSPEDAFERITGIERVEAGE